MAREISAAQLRQYVQDHHEKTYQIVDVRQPSEYLSAHIPGAVLLPLPQLARTPDTLPLDKDLIFYCHSGGRSQAAALLIEEQGADPARIFNLDGGILAWDGARLADQPRIALFAGQPLAVMLETAMNLEKGALLFYRGARQRYADSSWADLLERLAAAETGHARIVYTYRRPAGGDGSDFETLFDGLDGEILEGGMPLQQVLGDLPEPGPRACLTTIEVALKIENAAFDLYRLMAEHTRSDQAKEIFLNLAEAEKAHIRMLIDAIGGCSRQRQQ